MYKTLFTYLKDNGIQHEFNGNTGEVIVNRNSLSHEFRTFVIDTGFNIFELDTTVVIF